MGHMPVRRQIKCIQYGTAGNQEIPRNLTLESFLAHARNDERTANRSPKVLFFYRYIPGIIL